MEGPKDRGPEDVTLAFMIEMTTCVNHTEGQRSQSTVVCYKQHLRCAQQRHTAEDITMHEFGLVYSIGTDCLLMQCNTVLKTLGPQVFGSLILESRVQCS